MYVLQNSVYVIVATQGNTLAVEWLPIWGRVMDYSSVNNTNIWKFISWLLHNNTYNYYAKM